MQKKPTYEELEKRVRKLEKEGAERKSIEEALRNTNELLEKIFSTTHMLIAYMDKDFNFIRVNHAYAVADGRDPGFFAGKNHFELYPDEDNQSIYSRVVEQGEPYSAYAKPFEYAEHPERGLTYWDWTLYPVKTASGQVKGLVLGLVNVTRRIKAEEALRQSRKHFMTAQENEKKRVAQELHDSIGQSLTAIKFGLENSLEERAGRTAEARVESSRAVIPLVQQAIEEVRRIHTDLRPSILDDLGILTTINWFCREFRMIYSDIRIEKEVAVQENEVPEPLKMVIFRVLQEAMNNIAKHSDADFVRLCFRKTDSAIALTVEDNGRGFDPEEALSLKNSEKRFGITSMKERTELTGGSFAIKSTPRAGTAISASWPQDSSIQEQKNSY
ncbi:MAG: histidine kinase [Desulfobacteria bacterium]